MNTRLKIIIAFISLSLTLSVMSNTYSRYVADTTGGVELALAKWQILVDETDITSGNSSSMVLTPTIEQSSNVKNGTIAPSSTGYFDINIDPSNVGVSFNYAISLALVNNNIPDLLITKYSIIDSSYKVGDTLKLNNISDNTITGTLDFNNAIPNYIFDSFTIRVYFEWYEGNNETMNDEADTQVGYQSATNNLTLGINASISFSQKISS